MVEPKADKPLLTEDLADLLEGYAEQFDCAFDPEEFCAEFDWFASDEAGKVAVFTVGGQNNIPDTVLANRDDYLAVAACLLDLPKRCEPVLLPGTTGRRDDWLAYASVGLFTFDYAHGRTDLCHYEAISRPARPLSLSELPDPVARELRRVRFAGLDFAKIQEIDISVLGSFRPADPWD